MRQKDLFGSASKVDICPWIGELAGGLPDQP